MNVFRAKTHFPDHCSQWNCTSYLRILIKNILGCNYIIMTSIITSHDVIKTSKIRFSQKFVSFLRKHCHAETKKRTKLSQKLIEISWRERWPTYTFACCRDEEYMMWVWNETVTERERERLGSAKERDRRRYRGRESYIVVQGRQQMV